MYPPTPTHPHTHKTPLHGLGFELSRDEEAGGGGEEDEEEEEEEERGVLHSFGGQHRLSYLTSGEGPAPLKIGSETMEPPDCGDGS